MTIETATVLTNALIFRLMNPCSKAILDLAGDELGDDLVLAYIDLMRDAGQCVPLDLQAAERLLRPGRFTQISKSASQ